MNWTDPKLITNIEYVHLIQKSRYISWLHNENKIGFSAIESSILTCICKISSKHKK